MRLRLRFLLSKQFGCVRLSGIVHTVWLQRHHQFMYKNKLQSHIAQCDGSLGHRNFVCRIALLSVQWNSIKKVECIINVAQNFVANHVHDVIKWKRTCCQDDRFFIENIVTEKRVNDITERFNVQANSISWPDLMSPQCNSITRITYYAKSLEIGPFVQRRQIRPTLLCIAAVWNMIRSGQLYCPR